MSDASRSDSAARRYLAALEAITRCVASQRLVAPTSFVAPNERIRLAFPGPPVSLRAPAGGPSGLLFDAELHVAVVEAEPESGRPRWRATTLMYQYRLLDHDERELLVYHWQPGDAYRGPDHPHLHVSAALNAQASAVDRRAIDLDKLHLATGLVSLAAFVRMLITEFHVAPRRPDWAAALDRSEPMLSEAPGQSGSPRDHQGASRGP